VRFGSKNTNDDLILQIETQVMKKKYQNAGLKRLCMRYKKMKHKIHDGLKAANDDFYIK
jgi:hypothetical protein